MTGRAFQERLRKRAVKAGVTVHAELADKLQQYFDLLARWNAKINLTAFDLVDPKDEALDRLLIEPLIAARLVAEGQRSVIDIGSGSGSPAIPFHLAAPATALTMVESKTRKAVFLREASRHLGLTTTVESARFEALLTRPELHERFDVMTIRAVRVEPSTLVTLQAFLRRGGELFWFLGGVRTPVTDFAVYPLVFSSSRSLNDASTSRLIVLSKDGQP